MSNNVNDLQVVIKAKELAKHTYILTSNANRYPKKYRHSLVDEIQIKCLHIYNTLLEANRTDINHYKRERLELQTKAITYCDEMLFYIELSKEIGIINERSMEYWSEMVISIKRMTIAWRTADRKR